MKKRHITIISRPFNFSIEKGRKPTPDWKSLHKITFSTFAIWNNVVNNDKFLLICPSSSNSLNRPNGKSNLSTGISNINQSSRRKHTEETWNFTRATIFIRLDSLLLFSIFCSCILHCFWWKFEAYLFDSILIGKIKINILRFWTVNGYYNNYYNIIIYFELINSRIVMDKGLRVMIPWNRFEIRIKIGWQFFKMWAVMRTDNAYSKVEFIQLSIPTRLGCMFRVPKYSSKFIMTHFILCLRTVSIYFAVRPSSLKKIINAQLKQNSNICSSKLHQTNIIIGISDFACISTMHG